MFLRKEVESQKEEKLILKSENTNQRDPVQPNVILHLKCSLKDVNSFNPDNIAIKDPLSYNPNVPPNIETYNPTDANYFNINENANQQLAYVQKDEAENNVQCNICSNKNNISEDDNVSMKDLNAKLKKLKIQYYKNLDTHYKPACFCVRMNTIIHVVIFQSMKLMMKCLVMVHFADLNVQQLF